MQEIFLQLSGEYQGRAEGHDFRLSLIQVGQIVEATVDWLHEDNETDDHCRLIGRAYKDHVALRYWRNAYHPNGADSGAAVIYPTAEAEIFTGEWYSFDVNGGREEWTLTKNSTSAQLVKGDYPSNAEIPIDWVIISPNSGVAKRQ